MRIVRLDASVLVGTAEEEIGAAHQVLVERAVLCDEDAQRAIAAPSAASRLLPCARDAAGIAREDRRVQFSNIDAQLERVGRHNAHQLAAAQAALDLPAVLRQVAGPVGLDALRKGRRRLAEPVAHADVHELGLPP